MKTTEFIIVYDNDTGPYDESYHEWWDIIKLEGDERICQCYSEEMANIIVNALTGNELTMRVPESKLEEVKKIIK